VTLSEALIHSIRDWLAQEGWSQREFAARLGVTQSTVSFLLGRKRRTGALDFYERLAGTMGRPLSQLFADLETRGAATEAQQRQQRRKGRRPEEPLIRLIGEPHVDLARDASAPAAPRVFISYHSEDVLNAITLQQLSQLFGQFLSEEFVRRRHQYVQQAIVEAPPPPTATESRDLGRSGASAQAAVSAAASAQPARRARSHRR